MHLIRSPVHIRFLHTAARYGSFPARGALPSIQVSGQGGLGWCIFQNRNELYNDKVFAGLVVLVLIGLLVESAVFQTIERLTVRRWGASR